MGATEKTAQDGEELQTVSISSTSDPKTTQSRMSVFRTSTDVEWTIQDIVDGHAVNMYEGGEEVSIMEQQILQKKIEENNQKWDLGFGFAERLARFISVAETGHCSGKRTRLTPTSMGVCKIV